jgi:hypothetical protein
MDGLLGFMHRARMLGAELLATSPGHYRGAAFLIRAGVSEATEWVDREDYARAEEALSEALALAEPVVSREPGVCFLGFTVAESWGASARVALLRGDDSGARIALDHLRREIEADRASLEREKVYAGFVTLRDVLEARMMLAAGRVDEARAMLRSIVSSLQRLQPTSLDLALSVDAIVVQCVDMAHVAPGKSGHAALLDELCSQIEPVLSASESLPGQTGHVRASRGWFEFVRADADGLRRAIEANRARPSFNAVEAYEAFRLERALRKLELRKES